MNCQECCEELAAYLEGLLDESRQSQIDSHLAECVACQAELQAVRELTIRLARNGLAVPAVSLEAAVMDRILHEQALQLRRLKMRKRLRVLGLSGAMAAAIAVLFACSFLFTQSAEAQKAAEVMAKGAEAVQNPATVHIVAKMRTLPNDNFSMIGAEYDFVPVEVWRQFGQKPKWRVEKPGRVVVMNGASTEMLIRPEHLVQLPQVTYGAFDSGCLLELASVHDMIAHEMRVAQANGWELTLTHEAAASGKQSIVTVEAKSGLPADDYLKNKFFSYSDTRRVYRFDAETKRLAGYRVYLHQSGGDVLILSVERIEYDKPIELAVFALKLPDKVNLYREPQQLPDNEKYANMSPEQAAKAFFEACAKEDWKEAEKFTDGPIGDETRYLGGLEIIHIGTPFQSAMSLLNGDWLVPYEIKLAMKVRCTVRNDNPAERYIVVFGPGGKPDAKRMTELKPLPDSGKYEKMTPKEAVQTFLSAYAKADVDEVQKFAGGAQSMEQTKQEMEVMRIVDFRVGEPTPAKEPGCWEVPVEMTVIKKWTLGLRPHKDAKRFIVDGGI